MPSFSPLSVGIFITGALVGLGFVKSGVDDIRTAPAPYMVAEPLKWNEGRKEVTQTHIVSGVDNMPAGWAARITGPGGAVLCEGHSKPFGASYTDGESSTFSPSLWTGGNCPSEIPSGSTLWAEWTYEVDGQVKRTSASCVTGKTCRPSG